MHPATLHTRQLTAYPNQERLQTFIHALWDAQPSYPELSNDDALTLALARNAYRIHDYDEVERLLHDCHFADGLNMLGVILEMNGDFVSARRMYQHALRTQARHFASAMNLRRAYELWEFGKTDIPLLL